MQVDPITPTLKAPGTKSLFQTCNKLLSSLAFKSNWRRYTMAHNKMCALQRDPVSAWLFSDGEFVVEHQADYLLWRGE